MFIGYCCSIFHCLTVVTDIPHSSYIHISSIMNEIFLKKGNLYVSIYVLSQVFYYPNVHDFFYWNIGLVSFHYVFNFLYSSYTFLENKVWVLFFFRYFHIHYHKSFKNIFRQCIVLVFYTLRWLDYTDNRNCSWLWKVIELLMETVRKCRVAIWFCHKVNV